jgi:hypothetical protein
MDIESLKQTIEESLPLTEEAIIRLFKEQGIDYRVERRDESKYELDSGYNRSRANLTISGEKVITVEWF